VRVHMLKSDVEMEEQKRQAEQQAEQEGLVHQHHDEHEHEHEHEHGHSHQPVVAQRSTERCANIKQDTLYAIALAVCVFLIVVLGAAILGALAHHQGWWFFAPANSTMGMTNGTAFVPSGNGTLTPVPSNGASDPACANCSKWVDKIRNNAFQQLAGVCAAVMNSQPPSTDCCNVLTKTFGGQACTQFFLSQEPSVASMVPGVAAQCNLTIPAPCPGTSFNLIPAGSPIPTSTIPSVGPETTTTPGATTAAPGGTTAAPGGTTAAPGGTTAAPGGTTAAPGGTTAVPGATTVAPEQPTMMPDEETTTAATTTTTAPP